MNISPMVLKRFLLLSKSSVSLSLKSEMVLCTTTAVRLAAPLHHWVCSVSRMEQDRAKTQRKDDKGRTVILSVSWWRQAENMQGRD